MRMRPSMTASAAARLARGSVRGGNGFGFIRALRGMGQCSRSTSRPERADRGYNEGQASVRLVNRGNSDRVPKMRHAKRGESWR